MTIIRTVNISKEDLEREYIHNEKTMLECAEFFGCGETLIHKRIREFGIPSFSRSTRLIGRTFSEEHKVALSNAQIGKHLGSKNPNWRGGVAKQNYLARITPEYLRWRRSVLKKYRTICFECGEDAKTACPHCGKKGDVHVHHKDEFSTNIEKRMVTENAIILCEQCHRNIHAKNANGFNSAKALLGNAEPAGEIAKGSSGACDGQG